MKRRSAVNRESRRGFLKDLAVAGGAVAAASVASPALAATEAEQTSKPEAPPEGYRVTPHVATYYRLARF